MTNNTKCKIMTLQFYEENKKVHIIYDLHQKDAGGFYLTEFQHAAVLKLLQMVIDTIRKDNLEDLR